MEENKNVVNPGYVEPVEIKSLDQVKNKINESRKIFVEKHTKIMKKNRIASGIFFGVTVLLVILGTQFQKLMGLSFGLLFAGLILIYLFTKKQKKEIDLAVQDYLYNYSLYCNSYIYDDEQLENIKIGYAQKPDVDLIKKINISDEITVINSRDLVTGKYNGLEFMSFDASLKTGNPKKEKEQKALFVGKIFSLNYQFKDEGRTLLYLKGCGDATPTKLEDVNQVSVSALKKEWAVYSSHKEYEKIFTSDLIKALNKLECNNIMNDVVISVVEGSVLVGFSYSDEAMIIPMNNEYETKHLELKKENYKVFEMINKALIGNSNFIK